MFSIEEVKDLVISTIVVGIIFSSFNLEILPMTILIVLLVFISHELAHKFMAQRYGFSAQYRKWNIGLFFGLILSLLGGASFVAPGAVYITPFNRGKYAFRISRINKKQYGKISLAGPLTNIIIGISAFVLSFYYSLPILNPLAKISLFLSLFNLIPFPPLDGFKVFRWDRNIWAVFFTVSLIGLLI